MAVSSVVTSSRGCRRGAVCVGGPGSAPGAMGGPLLSPRGTPRRRPMLVSGRRGVFRRRRSLFAFARACAAGIHAKRESSKGLSAVAAVARRAVGLGPAVSSCARPGDASGRLRFAARPGCGCAVSRAASSPSGSCGASASSVGAAAGSLERWAGAETQHRPMLCKSTGSMPRSVRPRAPCAPRPAFHVHPARRDLGQAQLIGAARKRSSAASGASPAPIAAGTRLRGSVEYAPAMLEPWLTTRSLADVLRPPSRAGAVRKARSAALAG